MIPTPRDTALAPLLAPGGPFELDQVNVAGYVCDIFRRQPATIRALLEDSKKFAGNTFLLYEDQQYSYARCYSEVAKTADFLQHRLGVKKGDTVAISMRNLPQWVIAYFAVVSMGGIAVALNSWWQQAEMEYALKDSGAKVLFADEQRAQVAAAYASASGLQIVGVGANQNLPEGALNFSELVAASAAQALPPEQPQPEDCASILYTSGSTGHPKGVLSTHRAVTQPILAWELEVFLNTGLQPGSPEASQLSQQDCRLLTSPLFHTNGIMSSILRALRGGGKVVMMYKWDAQRAMDLIDEHQVTAVATVPTISGDLVRTARQAGRSLPSLTSLGGGGAARSAEQVKAIDEVCINAVPSTGWGMTETNAAGTIFSGANYLSKPHCAGRPLVSVQLQVVGADGTSMPAGEPGELWIRGAFMFREYWNQPEATLEAHTDGWFHTGDVAYLDEDNCLFIVDRIKDLVIRGGENIGCGEVESAICTHPDVVETLVFGVPDDRLGEELACAVVLKPGGALSREQLQAHLQSVLAPYKVPRYMSFQAELFPRIASGKYNKKEVRRHFLSTLA